MFAWPCFLDAGVAAVRFSVFQVDKQLVQTTLSGSIITQDSLERVVLQRLGKTLSKGFTSSSIIT